MNPHTITAQTPIHSRMRNEHIDMRVCLSCGWWMRSIGPQHRICNTCKRDFKGTYLRAGSRIRPVHGMTESWDWKANAMESEFNNIINLDHGRKK